MRRSADVVILMLPSSDYSLLYPQSIDWDSFIGQKPDIPFADRVVDFLNVLSGSLLKDPVCRLYPDVVTFAFFCRKGNLLKLKRRYVQPGEIRLGRGLIFHIAPSNVPINFGYSLVSGLLAGNFNVVRVSSKPFSQVDLIVKHLKALSDTCLYNDVTGRIVLVRYDRDSSANTFFSSICNARIIWGGDSTVATIRQYPIPSRSFDVCFSDRYSIAVINPDTVVDASENEIRKLAQAFYYDTFLFDQNACSAPHTIYWLKAERLPVAKTIFWTAVHSYASQRYELQAIMAVDKLNALYREAVHLDCSRAFMPDNLIVRAELKNLSKDIENYRCTCGFFNELTIDSLDDIASVINLKYQTLSYYGIEVDELDEFVRHNRLQGLDRIVPVGDTTSFSLTWDGYNLIETLSRLVSIL